MRQAPVKLTAAQVAAGNAAMKGDFTMREVTDALLEAGVSKRGIIADRAADQLLIAARDRGDVRFVVGKLWRAK